MKKGALICLFLLVSSIFVSSFIFAEELSNNIDVEFIKTIPRAFSAVVVFKPTSEADLASCSVSLLSPKDQFSEDLNEVNNSKINRISVSNLSSSTSYQGKVSCEDILGNVAESSTFVVVTNSSGKNPVVNNKTEQVNQSSTNVSITNTAPSNVDSLSDKDLLKNIIMGSFFGLGALFFLGGISYILWRLFKKRN